MKRAILMSRVSSDEQAKGYSLDIQVEKLSDHCRKQNISVVNAYREDHSAKNFNRPEFKKLLAYLKTNKGKVDLLLITTWDRFSRNLTESFSMIEQLRLLGVEVQAVDQPLDLSVPENLMILSVYLALPDIDNKRRSIKTTEGVRAAAASGRWQGLAPFGYKNSRDEQNKPILVPGEKAEVVQKIFADLAKGKSQAEVRQALKKKGIAIPKSTFSVITRNRVYVGEIHVRNAANGFYVKGLHEPLIERTVFDKVQALLLGNYKVQQLAKPKAFQDELHLRGLLLCEHCGQPVTGSASRSRTGKRHFYYHCNHCKAHRIRAERTHEIMATILSELKVNRPATALYDTMVKKLLQKKQRDVRPLPTVQAEIIQAQSRLQTLDDNLMDKVIDGPTYASLKTRYTTALQKLQAEAEHQGSSQSEFQKFLRTSIHLLEDLPTFYEKSSLQTKRAVVSSIFPEKIAVGENKSRTAKINEAVLLITATDKGFSGKRPGQLLKNLELSRQVAPTGIELLLLVVSAIERVNLRSTVGCHVSMHPIQYALGIVGRMTAGRTL